jgi:hypothetical protein
VLLQHLVVFGFIYPGERHRIPADVMRHLMSQLEKELEAPVKSEQERKVCRGTVLSRQQYLSDVNGGGYVDVRSLPENPMTTEDIARWTAGIQVDGAK